MTAVDHSRVISACGRRVTHRTPIRAAVDWVVEAALGWPLGLALLGLAAARSRVFDRPPRILLAVSGPLFLGLEGPFLPIAGALSAVLFGVAQMWWGLLLWRSAGVPEPTAA